MFNLIDRGLGRLSENRLSETDCLTLLSEWTFSRKKISFKIFFDQYLNEINYQINNNY